MKFTVTLRINADINIAVSADGEKEAEIAARRALKRRFAANTITFADFRIFPEFVGEAEIISVFEAL